MIKNLSFYCIFVFFLLSCKANKILFDEFCNNEKLEFKNQIIIDFSNKLSFDKDNFTVIEQDLVEDFANCLKKYQYKNLEILIYFNGGSLFEIEMCSFRGLNLEKLLISYGIDESKIKSLVKHDKNNTFRNSSPYRRVEVILHK
jgi:hypothetical protein